MCGRVSAVATGAVRRLFFPRAHATLGPSVEPRAARVCAGDPRPGRLAPTPPSARDAESDRGRTHVAREETETHPVRL